MDDDPLYGTYSRSVRQADWDYIKSDPASKKDRLAVAANLNWFADEFEASYAGRRGDALVDLDLEVVKVQDPELREGLARSYPKLRWYQDDEHPPDLELGERMVKSSTLRTIARAALETGHPTPNEDYTVAALPWQFLKSARGEQLKDMPHTTIPEFGDDVWFIALPDDDYVKWLVAQIVWREHENDPEWFGGEAWERQGLPPYE